MINIIVAVLAGSLFGLGLSLSGMVDPNKVLGFLDLAGDWDPSLMLVMMGALAVAMPGFFWVRRHQRPMFDDRFHVTDKTALEPSLLMGASIFGIGWGMTGYCPGPAVAGLILNNPEAWWMVASIYVGFWLAGWCMPKS